MENLYNMIFKRKSIRKYNNDYLNDNDLDKIKEKLITLKPLIDDIKVDYKIVKKEETTSRFGQFCLLMYSEIKPNYLMNAGYLLEQMDLYLESIGIGVCWCGLGKTEEKKYNNLEFVIMLAFGNTDEQFRNNISEFNRKDINTIWKGDFDLEVKNIFRLAPSSCNTQPWFVESNENCIKLYQDTNVKAFVSDELLTYSNQIDLGICIYFLDLGLNKKGYKYFRKISYNKKDSKSIEVAVYNIIKD